MTTILDKTDDSSVDVLAKHLLKGKIAIVACDTIYGLVGIVPTAKEALLQIKGRQQSKDFIQLATLEMAQQIAVLPLALEVLQLWPGPLTLIVPNAEGTTTAVRVPADPYLQKVLEIVGQPVYSTSVNVSGEKELFDFTAMITRFSKQIELFIKGPQQQGNISSTILDVSQKPYTLLRQGACDVTALLQNKE